MNIPIKTMKLDSEDDIMNAILSERMRQIYIEGYDEEHDTCHTPFGLAIAGSCYINSQLFNNDFVPIDWPFEPIYWKPKDRIADLIRAGALYLAAMDLLNFKYEPDVNKKDICAEFEYDEYLDGAELAVKLIVKELNTTSNIQI